MSGPIRNKVRWAFVILSIALAFSFALNGLLLWRRPFTEEQTEVATLDSERSDTLCLAERKAAAFALYAMKLREEELSKIEPQTFVPTLQKPAVRGYPWKTNVSPGPHKQEFDVDFNAELPPWDFFPIWWLAKSWHCSRQHVI
jgi:hypothetical protein